MKKKNKIKKNLWIKKFFKKFMKSNRKFYNYYCYYYYITINYN